MHIVPPGRSYITHIRSLLAVIVSFFAGGAICAAQAPPSPGIVLVELFTSEGCSDCPPADDLLRKIAGRRSPAGQQIVGISEHVTYWNRLGWSDPFSADQFTQRQNDYGNRFGLNSVYTPQMVVNGREQFVGANQSALGAALHSELDRKQIHLRIQSAQTTDKSVIFTFSGSDLPPKVALQVVAVLVDDEDKSNVLRGENSGRQLTHAWVARSMSPLGKLNEAEERSVTLPLPPSFLADPGRPHHLVVFAQQGVSGVVLGADATPLTAAVTAAATGSSATR